MPDIKITFEEVRVKAKEIRTYNNTLTDTLNTIRQTINNLESQWTSDTSDTIRAKINGMERTFITYKEVIESYAAFLDNTAAQYEGAESTLNSNASGQFI